MIVKSLFFPQFRDVSAVPVIAVCWVVALVPTIPLWFGRHDDGCGGGYDGDDDGDDGGGGMTAYSHHDTFQP